MSLQHGVRVFVKHTVNRLTRTFAGRSRTPFVLVRHVGRRSGKPYETPIIAIRSGDSFIIELTYGPNVDWYRNVQAANGGQIVWHGQTFTIDGVTPLDTASGYQAFPPPVRAILHLLRRQDFVRLHIAADAPEFG